MAIKVRGINKRGKTVEAILPKLVTLTLKAGEISAGWWEDYLQALVECDEVKPGDLVKTVWIESNTLDQGGDLSGVTAYSSEASLQEALDNNEQTNAVIGGISPDGTYRYGITHSTSIYAFVLKSGAKMGLIFGADAAPTTGEITIRIEVVPK